MVSRGLCGGIHDLRAWIDLGNAVSIRAAEPEGVGPKAQPSGGSVCSAAVGPTL